MIISADSSTQEKGLLNYLENGTIDKKRDISKVRLMNGDFQIAELLKSQIQRKKKAFNFVISLSESDTHINKEIFDQLNEETLNLILVGLNREDVHVSSMEHTDTKNRHSHNEIVDAHLITEQELRLYSHKKDVRRYELIRDYIEAKYDLTTTSYEHKMENTFNEKNIYARTQKQKDRINKWRKERGAKEWKCEFLEMKSGADKALSYAKLVDILKRKALETTTNNDGEEEFIFKDIHDVRAFLTGLTDVTGQNLTITSKVDAYSDNGYKYIRLQNSFGDKIKLESDLFDTKFYELDKKDRIESIKSNKSKINQKPKPKLEDIEALLNKEQEKRKEFIFKTIKKHSNPEAIYPLNVDGGEDNSNKYINLKTNNLKNKKAAEVILDSEFVSLDPTTEIFKIKKDEVLKKYNLDDEDLLNPKDVEEKSDGKVKYIKNDDNEESSSSKKSKNKHKYTYDPKDLEEKDDVINLKDNKKDINFDNKDVKEDIKRIDKSGHFLVESDDIKEKIEDSYVLNKQKQVLEVEKLVNELTKDVKLDDTKIDKIKNILQKLDLSKDSKLESSLINKIEDFVLIAKKDVSKSDITTLNKIDNILINIDKHKDYKIDTKINDALNSALEIVSQMKNKNDSSSVKTDFNGFKDLEDTFKHKVKEFESSELKAEFTKIVDTDKFKREHEQEKSSIIKPDMSHFKDGFDKLIEVDKKEAKKILNTKIHEFLDTLKDEKNNKLYQVEEKKHQYSIKDKSGKEWYIIDHNGEQLLFNQKEKQVQTLFQFIKQDLKLSYIQTHSFLQEKAQIKYIIRCNQDRAAFQQQILRMIQQKQILDLKGFNKELSQYDKHARIRFEAQKDAELRNVDLNTPYSISINNIMHPIEEMIPNPTIDKMKEEMAKNRDIKAKEQKTLDELFDEDPYLNQTFEIDLDDDPRSVRSHKFK
jgi:hypothetical protein